MSQDPQAGVPLVWGHHRHLLAHLPSVYPTIHISPNPGEQTQLTREVGAEAGFPGVLTNPGGHRALSLRTRKHRTAHGSQW